MVMRMTITTTTMMTMMMIMTMIIVIIIMMITLFRKEGVRQFEFSLRAGSLVEQLLMIIIVTLIIMIMTLMMMMMEWSRQFEFALRAGSLVEQLLKSSKSPSFVSIHLGWHIKILKQSNWINNFNSFWLKPQNTQTIQIDKWILLKNYYFFCTQYFWNTFTLLLT